MTTEHTDSPHDKLTLSQPQLDVLIEQAATRGARNALAEMGLTNEETVNELRTLRGLARTLKTMQHTFLQTIVRWLTIGMLVLVFTGVAGKLDTLIHMSDGK